MAQEVDHPYNRQRGAGSHPPVAEVAPVPARLERAATLTDYGLGRTFTGWMRLGRDRL